MLRLRRARTIQVGRLGRFEFEAGYYVYTGSAMGGLEARLARHQRQRKKLWWHIDYLLRQAELVDVAAVPTSRRVECERNRWVLSLPGADIPVKGFGSSDCNCVTHLVRLGEGRATVSTLAGPAR